jgi:hypothetical protein
MFLSPNVRKAPVPVPNGATPARPHAAVAFRRGMPRPVASKLRLTVVQAEPAVGTEQTLVSFTDAEQVPAFVNGQINKFPLQSGVFAVYDSKDGVLLALLLAYTACNSMVAWCCIQSLALRCELCSEIM